MLYIGVSDDVALKLQPIKIPLTVKKNEEKRTTKTLSKQIDDPNIEAALSYATQINSQKVNNTNKPLKRSQYYCKARRHTIWYLLKRFMVMVINGVKF